MSDRPGFIIRDIEHPVQGEMLEIGDAAPDFALVANDMATIKTLADFAGKVKIVSVVPSLDTGLCSTQTRRFNAEAAALGGDVVVITVSADLPYAQRRWCGAEGLEGIVTLSTHRDMKFSDDYGVHVTSWRINQRSVFVLDRENVVQLAQYMPVIGHEVDFEAVLNKARDLL